MRQNKRNTLPARFRRHLRHSLGLGALLAVAGQAYALDAGYSTDSGMSPQGLSPNSALDIGGYRPLSTGAFDPAAYKLGPVALTPVLGMAYGYDDNVNLLNGTGQVGSSLFALMPKINAVLQQDTSRYEAYYNAILGRYASASTYDYNDSSMGASATNSWSSRLLTRLKVDYSIGHDPANAYVITNAPERWVSPTIQALVHYGAEDAIGQGELEAGYSQHHYITDPGLMNQFDMNTSQVAGRFFYRLAPKTHWVTQLLYQTNTFISPISMGRSNVEERATTGVQWDATDKLSGRLMAGVMTDQMNQNGLTNNTGLAWDANLTYKPLTYSSIALDGSRNYAQSFDPNSNFVITQGANLGWTHDWNSKIRTLANYFTYTDQYQGYYRVDERRGGSIKISYALQRWLRAGLQYESQSRNSNVSQWSFTDNITMFTLEGSL